MYSLFGVENPLMDVIAHVDYELLRRFHKEPGTMHLVDYPEIATLLGAVGEARTMAGGSAANTVRGVAWLRGGAGRALADRVLGRAASGPPEIELPVFNGAIGRDERGDRFASCIADAGAESSLVRTGTPTGTSVILVTPDGERTMNTFLGACRDFQASDLDLGRLGKSRMLYLTAYLWDTENQQEAAKRAAAFAHARGLAVAFDLADPFAVKRYGPLLRAWIPGNVDVLFGNREELALLTGSSCDEDCVMEAASLAPIVALKVGEKGALVGWGGRCESVPGVKVKVVDTTGAGDAFAAGFLYGRLSGADPVASATLANVIASRIVGTEGCSYES